MGCGCNKSERAYDPLLDGGDQPVVNMALIKDPLVKFEKSFPFYRCHITRMRE